MKKLRVTIICIFFAVALTLVSLHFMSPKTGVCIDPTETSSYPYETLMINVSVSEVWGLCSYSIIIYYDTIPVNAISVDFPSDHFLEPLKWEKLAITKSEVRDNYNATHGRIWVSAKLLSTAPRPRPTCAVRNIRQIHQKPNRDGSGLLFRVAFNCTGKGTSILTLHKTRLFRFPQSSIAHSQKHGLIETQSSE